MAKGLIEIALQLGKQLGANTSKFLGTKSNVTFMGPGPKDGMLFQQSINPESFATIGIEKVLPDIETSLGYAVGGKLNDIQLSTLIKNLKTMDETLNPTNVVEMGGGIASLSENPARGFIKQGDAITSENFGTSQFAPGNNSEFLKNIDTDSLRAKSGLGERQVTEAADSDGFIGKMKAQYENSVIDKTNKMPGTENENFELLQRSLRDSQDGVTAANMVKRQGGTPEEQQALFEKLRLTNLKEPSSVKLVDDFVPAGDEAATGIMQTVAKGDMPAKTGAAREFLVNTLKVGDEASSTTLSDVISARDMKFIMEGGGGAEGDPLVLVQKYFGPRIAEMIPTGGTAEEISIFTKRVMDNVEDAKGLRPDEPDFDPLTAKFVDQLADGGRAGYAKGGLAKILEL